MRIVILTTSHNAIGGVERFTEYLRQVLVERGCNVVVLAKEDLPKWQQFIVTVSRYFAVAPIKLGYFLGRRAIKEHADAVVTNGLLGWSYSGTSINVQHGTYAMSAVRIDLKKNIIKYLVKRFWGIFEGIAARRAKQCVAVSVETKQSVENFYRAKNVAVILNAVDTNLFQSQPVIKKNQAVFVGRFEIAKGKKILETMQAYLKSREWNLLVAEQLSQTELVRAYNESRVFLLPSLHEGCSYALLDAMACELPFLASPVGLVAAFREQGIFVENIVTKQTSESYINAFEHLISKGELHTDELREYIVKNHDLKSFGDAYYAIIKSL